MLGPLRRGAGDPCFSTDGGLSFAANTPGGPGTLRVTRVDGVVHAEAWGDGAVWLLDGLPALLGADDPVDDFVAHHDLVAEIRRWRPGLRLGSCGRVWDVLFPAILEQKVTGKEAWRTWRELCRRFGTDAPGPLGLKVPPTPDAILRINDWEWHRAGLDGARRRALVACAQVAHRLEKAAELRGEEGRSLLRKVPGVGVWTAAEVAQRAWGDPDAVSYGDFHIAKNVGYALTGKPVDDDGMMELLEPYTPQRQRAVRYIEGAGIQRPRRAPRFSPRDYRGF
ncbi:3-methyladenine DNA glycosylase [Lentzea sp. NBRC 105346]|nr:3-methyladenine DNA glycosylase [Lentzea sp. NBRC 105346]